MPPHLIRVTTLLCETLMFNIWSNMWIWWTKTCISGAVFCCIF